MIDAFAMAFVVLAIGLPAAYLRDHARLEALAGLVAAAESLLPLGVLLVKGAKRGRRFALSHRPR
jgi:hypothetical protein